MRQTAVKISLLFSLIREKAVLYSPLESIITNFAPLMRKKARYGAWVSYLGMDIAYYIGRKWGQKGTMIMKK